MKFPVDIPFLSKWQPDKEKGVWVINTAWWEKVVTLNIDHLIIKPPYFFIELATHSFISKLAKVDPNKFSTSLVRPSSETDTLSFVTSLDKELWYKEEVKKTPIPFPFAEKQPYFEINQWRLNIDCVKKTFKTLGVSFGQLLTDDQKRLFEASIKVQLKNVMGNNLGNRYGLLVDWDLVKLAHYKNNFTFISAQPGFGEIVKPLIEKHYKDNPQQEQPENLKESKYAGLVRSIKILTGEDWNKLSDKEIEGYLKPKRCEPVLPKLSEIHDYFNGLFREAVQEFTVKKDESDKALTEPLNKDLFCPEVKVEITVNGKKVNTAELLGIKDPGKPTTNLY